VKGMSDETGDQGAADGTPKKHRMPLWMLFLNVGWTLASMMQAALVKGVAFGWFSRDPDAFRGHPNNGSLTWQALESHIDQCVLKIVEQLRNRLYKPHVPANVTEKLKRLAGHRNLIGHPSMIEEDWGPEMQRFIAEGRRFESPVPLIWDLQRAINAELAKEPEAKQLPEFHVTWEMVHLLRTILVSRLLPEKLPEIPVDDGLVILLQNSRDRMLQQCQAIADGVPLPSRPETALERKWADLLAEQERRMGKTE
jgi:hypothetical protein